MYNKKKFDRLIIQLAIPEHAITYSKINRGTLSKHWNTGSRVTLSTNLGGLIHGPTN